MSGRIVIISGANGGLGTAVTKRFLEAADYVIGSSNKIQASVSEHTNFVAIPADFTKFDSVRELTDKVVQRFYRVDVFVHLIGGFAGGTPLHDTDDTTWRRMHDHNLTTAFNAIRAIIPRMREIRRGRFIAVGSKAAEHPLPNLGAYVISKTALVTLIKTVALENADRNITANIVLPGTMDTAANRVAMPNADRSTWVSTSEVAEAIFWLASDAAAHVTGAAIPVA
jgi:NAD(P)-dependent dehydrogenase (short-subunit alcohol dehydrogenase family)